MLVDIVNRQAKNARVSVVVINNVADPSLLASLNSRVTVHRINRPPGSLNPWFWFKLSLLIRELAPDIVHCHDSHMIRVLPRRRVPAILTVHGTRAQLDETIRRFDRTCAISKAVARHIEASIAGTHPLVVYNGIDLEAVVQRSRPSAPPFRVVQVGRLEHLVKGQDILLNALRRVLQDRPDLGVSIDFIGDGPSRGFLEGLAVSLNVADHVRFLGSLSRQRLYGLLHEYDILIQPSRAEGFGLAVVEGLAARLPVVASDLSGPLEIIADGQHGFVFRTGQADSCAHCLIDVMEFCRSNRCSDFLDRALIHAQRLFSIDATVDSYARCYVGARAQFAPGAKISGSVV